MTTIFNDTDLEPWVLPHMGNKPNDADDMILYNRELSDAANWRRSVESSDDLGDWEGCGVTSAGHHAVLVVAITGTVAVLVALLAGWL